MSITFQYLKFIVSEVVIDSSGRVSISDFCVMNNGIRVDYSLANASESPDEDSGDTPENAIDNVNGEGNVSTKWGNNGIEGNGSLFTERGPVTLIIDFGQRVTANQYKWASSDSSVPQRNPKSWTVQVSLDNTDWSTVSTQSGYVSGINSGEPDNGPSQTYSDTFNMMGVCVLSTTKILLCGNKIKEIKDIIRGDLIIINKQTNEYKPVANITKTLNTKAILIPKGLINNTNDLICTLTHPIWIGESMRIRAKDIKGTKKIHVNDYFYNIQFEDEGCFYAENIKVDSLSPNCTNMKLPKELYFNKSKYNNNISIDNLDDKRSDKPKFLSSYDPVSYNKYFESDEYRDIASFI